MDIESRAVAETSDFYTVSIRSADSIERAVYCSEHAGCVCDATKDTSLILHRLMDQYQQMRVTGFVCSPISCPCLLM